MATTASYIYQITPDGTGRYVVSGVWAAAPNGISFTETATGPGDDLSRLGDHPTDRFHYSGPLTTGSNVPYQGLISGDRSAFAFGGNTGFFATDRSYEIGAVVDVLRVDPVAGLNLYDLENDRPIYVTCFAQGTRILTASGEVSIEALLEGDLLVTHFGDLTPIRWIGRRVVNIAAHPEPHRVRPVRISVGALAEDVPHRDLLVSPEHALFLDGQLVHAKTLVNGATITQEAWDAVTYFHLDLGHHDVLLAEGAPAESYLNEDGRASFDNAASAPVVALHAGGAACIPACAPCAPFLRPGPASSPALLAITARLIERAEALGWSRTQDAEMHLVADGRVIRPQMVSTGAFRFAVPSGVRCLTLASRTGRPFGTVPGSTDGRWLGVQLQALSFQVAGEAVVPVSLDDPALIEGVWPCDTRGGAQRRWTTGEADLGPALGQDLVRGGTFEVRVASTHNYWVRAQVEQLAAA